MAKSITIRDVPDEIHAELSRRATLHDQSFQQYLMAQLREIAERADMEELVSRARERSERHGVDISAEEIVKWIHEAREEREEHLASLLTRPSSSQH